MSIELEVLTVKGPAAAGRPVVIPIWSAVDRTLPDEL